MEKAIEYLDEIMRDHEVDVGYFIEELEYIKKTIKQMYTNQQND